MPGSSGCVRPWSRALSHSKPIPKGCGAGKPISFSLCRRHEQGATPMALGTAWTQAGSFLLKSAAFCPQGSVPARACACACIMTHTYAHVHSKSSCSVLLACKLSGHYDSTSSAEATFALETQVPSRRRSEHLAETHFEKHSLCGSLSYTLVPTGSPTPPLPWLAGALGGEGSS